MRFFTKILVFLLLFWNLVTWAYADNSTIPANPTSWTAQKSGLTIKINGDKTSNTIGGENRVSNTTITDGSSARLQNSIVSIDALGSDKDMKIWNLTNQTDLRDMIVSIAKSIRNIFYILASVYFIIIAIRLITTSNTEEEVQNFKKWILYITVGIIIMNLAFAIVYYLYNDASLWRASTDIDLWNYGYRILENIMYPIIKLLETATAFFFLLIALFSFFRLITANGNEDEARRGRMSIFYAILGFVLVIIAAELVFTVYGDCQWGLSQTAQIFGTTCTGNTNISGVVGIIIEVIKWLNSFVAVAVIIMIIYSGFTIMFSGGNEEKITNARKSIIYIFVGIGILVINFLILTFFL